MNPPTDEQMRKAKKKAKRPVSPEKFRPLTEGQKHKCRSCANVSGVPTSETSEPYCQFSTKEADLCRFGDWRHFTPTEAGTTLASMRNFPLPTGQHNPSSFIANTLCDDIDDRVRGLKLIVKHQEEGMKEAENAMIKLALDIVTTCSRSSGKLNVKDRDRWCAEIRRITEELEKHRLYEVRFAKG